MLTFLPCADVCFQDIINSEATLLSDKYHILNSIANEDCEEEALGNEPDWDCPAFHAIDCSLRGIFAHAALSSAAQRSPNRLMDACRHLRAAR